MDLRSKRTKERIINAFLELQETKPYEKITIRALCEAAEINKSTFYNYYASISDISSQIECEIIRGMLANIPEQALVFSKPELCLELITEIHASQAARFLARLSKTRRAQILVRLHSALKEQVFAAHPEYQDDFTVNFYISYIVYGSFYAFYENSRFSERELYDAIAKVMEYLCRGVAGYTEPSVGANAKK